MAVAVAVVAEKIRSHPRFHRDTWREVTVLLRLVCKESVGVCGVLAMLRVGVRMEGMNVLLKRLKVSRNQSNSSSSNATLPHDHCGKRGT